MRCAWPGLRSTPLLVLLLPTLVHSTADRTDHDIFCVEACSVALKKVWFGDTNRTEPRAAPRECYSNVPHLQSLYLGGGVYCGREAVDEGLAAVNQTCRDVVDRPLPSYDELIGNFTEEDVEGFPRFDVDGPSFEGPVKGPVLPTEGLVELWIRTLVRSCSILILMLAPLEPRVTPGICRLRRNMCTTTTGPTAGPWGCSGPESLQSACSPGWSGLWRPAEQNLIRHHGGCG